MKKIIHDHISSGAIECSCHAIPGTGTRSERSRSYSNPTRYSRNIRQPVLTTITDIANRSFWDKHRDKLSVGIGTGPALCWAELSAAGRVQPSVLWPEQAGRLCILTSFAIANDGTKSQVGKGSRASWQAIDSSMPDP